MSLVEIVILVIMAYIMLYALVDRICKCAENRAMAKAYFASMATQKNPFAGLNNALKAFGKQANVTTIDEGKVKEEN